MHARSLPDRKLEFASIDALRDYLAARPRDGADASAAARPA
ncbi:hypothetical protein ACFFWD_06395 [Bradyrhizobium erythrophlei]